MERDVSRGQTPSREVDGERAAHTGSVPTGLDGWVHCPRCSGRLEALRHAARCGACGLELYDNPAPAICALVIDADGRVLLGRRAREPYKGLWDVLGGFMEPDEQPWETLRRELREETGLDVEPVEFVAAVTDRYGEDGPSTLNVAWTARVVGGTLEPADDVAELAWFRPDELPAEDELAFRNSVEILATWARAR
jgi:NAD+ diphosphatase